MIYDTLKALAYPSSGATPAESVLAEQLRFMYDLPEPTSVEQQGSKP